jgi:hypothetical protein
MPMLNITELHKTIDQKKKTRLLCYETILEKCHKRIIDCSKKEQTFCLFIVPEYIIGLPIINNYECTQFLIESLKENGFDVTYTFPNLIYISWNKEKPKNKNLYLSDKSFNNTHNNSQKLLNFDNSNQKNKFSHSIDELL